MHSIQRIIVLLLFVAVGLAAAGAVVVLPTLRQQVSPREKFQPARVDGKSLVVNESQTQHSLSEELLPLDEVEFPSQPSFEPIIHPAERSPAELGRDAEETSTPPLQQPRKIALDEVLVSPLPPPLKKPTPAPVVPAQSTASPAAPPAFTEIQSLLQRAAGNSPPIPAAPAADANPSAAQQSPPPQDFVARPSPSGEGDDKLDIVIPNTDIREVLELLSKAGGLNILASENVTGPVKASLTGVDVDTALSAILKSAGYVSRREGNFIYVGTAKDFLAMDHSLDRVSTRVYRPNYVSAAELQTLMTPMLTPAIGTISVSNAAQVGIGADSNSAGGNNFAGAEVLLVRDFEGVLAQIDQVFDEVDRRPLQVSIEAMILSVKLNDELTLGVNWDLLRSSQHIRLAFGAPVAALDDAAAAASGGLKVAFLDSNLGAFIDCLEKVGETHVISSPRLMCLNKQRAEIHIGEERGYISTTVTETAATQSVEFLEVGTQLRLRPYISNDGMIRLEIHPELSTGTVEVTDNFTLPRKNVTQVTTNVMVRDGATLVIGGLLREDLNKDVSQIPLLGSLPWVGPVFQHQTDTTTRDEVIVLVTPRIVWEPRFNCEGEYADCEAHQQHSVMADKMSHITRVYYGRRYRRLAKAAWMAGDAGPALRYINMSIHFNPLDRESIQLRSEIVANSPYGDATVDSHLREGLRPCLDHGAAKRYPNWVFDELQGPHTHVGQEPAPVQDQGATGYRSDIFAPSRQRRRAKWLCRRSSHCRIRGRRPRLDIAARNRVHLCRPGVDWQPRLQHMASA